MQLDLIGLLGRIDAAKAMPIAQVSAVTTYREACRMCWLHRRVKGMTLRSASELCGLYPAHVTDYLHGNDSDKHGKARRDLPAHKVAAFEAVTGNSFISQWLAMQSGLTVLESYMSERVA